MLSVLHPHLCENPVALPQAGTMTWRENRHGPSHGIGTARVVNPVLSQRIIWWVVTSQASEDVVECGDVDLKLLTIAALFFSALTVVSVKVMFYKNLKISLHPV